MASDRDERPAPQAPGVMGRLGRAWHALPPERRLAAAGCVALIVALFLPWYQKNASIDGGRLASADLSALQAFTFVEGGVLLIAVAVLALLFMRAERRVFHLPGGDGTIVTIAGAWACLLIVWRLFDRPGVAHSERFANVGIQWGIVFALAAAGLLTYAGVRMRAAHRAEPERRDERRGARAPAGPPRRPVDPDFAVSPPEAPDLTASRGRPFEQDLTVRLPDQRPGPNGAPEGPGHEPAVDEPTIRLPADAPPPERRRFRRER